MECLQAQNRDSDTKAIQESKCDERRARQGPVPALIQSGPQYQPRLDWAERLA